MRLTVVGCSGSLAAPGAACSCYLVEADWAGGTYRLVLDLGSGALGPLQTVVGIEEVDAVALSHLHADHCLDLTGLYVAKRYAPGGPGRRIDVVGPAGTAARIARAHDLADPGRLDEYFAFSTWADGATTTMGPFTVTAARVRHPVEAYALRLEADGGVLVYSGDTGPCEALVRLAAGADLLLCEASYVDGGGDDPDIHMSAREVGQHAAAARVGRLVLTHVPPWNDWAAAVEEAWPVFDGPVDYAVPDAVYELVGGAS